MTNKDRLSGSNSIINLLPLWFGFSKDVGRLAYVATGISLMGFKYSVEAGVIYFFTERFFSPLDFLNPSLAMRQHFLMPPAPEWLAPILLVWSLPFVWVMVSMSVRRSTDAGCGPWPGLLVLVPGFNYFLMILLSISPRRATASWSAEKPQPIMLFSIRSALLGIFFSMLITLFMVLISVYAFAEYGVVLFLGTPILVGTVSAFLYNRPHPRTLLGSLFVTQLSILFCGVGLLLFAIEGIICLFMLYPVAGAMGILGGLIGYTIAVMTPTRSTTMLLPVMLLPIAAGAESTYRPTTEYEVQSMVEIDAPPEKVWPHVVGFSELPPPPDWYFQLGIAYPQRATIAGSGVGAIRHCEFSTGAFVEPITVWDEPRRLSFDVQSQPPPMHELSPYQHVHPPHLDGYLRCQRGEFRLTALPLGRTRLEGSTWYEFEMYPQDYWTLWSDLCIRRIHRRVLTHIKALSEAE